MLSRSGKTWKQMMEVDGAHTVVVAAVQGAREVLLCRDSGLPRPLTPLCTQAIWEEGWVALRLQAPTALLGP